MAAPLVEKKEATSRKAERKPNINKKKKKRKICNVEDSSRVLPISAVGIDNFRLLNRSFTIHNRVKWSEKFREMHLVYFNI